MSESFAIPLSSFMKTENHLRKKRLGNSPSRDTMNFGLTNQVQSLERSGKVCLSRKNKSLFCEYKMYSKTCVNKSQVLFGNWLG